MNPFFDMFDNNNPYKWVSLTYSIIATTVSTPLLYLVIMFQKENPYTTLLHQILSNILGVAILNNIFVHIPFVLLYIFGPFPQLTCYLILIIQGSLTIQALLLVNIMMITRYIFTFILKNPAAVHHDFWRTFIFVFTFLSGIIVQTTYSVLPGNNPGHFYICSGIIPINYNKSNNKINYGIFVLMFFTLCSHAVLGLRIKLYDWTKGSAKVLANLKTELKSGNYNILNITYQMIIVMSYMIVLMPLVKIVSMNLTSFQTFPAYVWLYLYHLYAMQSFELLSLTILFMKNSQLFVFVIRNIQSTFRLW